MSAPSVCSYATTSFVDTSVGRQHFYEAKRLASQGKYLKSKQMFKFVIQLRPDAAAPHYHLGCVLIELNCLQEAISHFKKATNLKPNITKYKSFYKWYSILYQCKYNNGQTPGGPNDNNNKENENKNSSDDEEEEEEENNCSDEDIDCKDITDYNNDYYSLNKHKFNKYTVHKLLKEFCPSQFHLKPNATHKQTLYILNKAIKLYDPRNNKNENDKYYKYNTKNQPNLNQKHLYQLLIHHKDLLVKKRKLYRRGNICAIIESWSFAVDTIVPANVMKEASNFSIGIPGAMKRYEPPELSKEYFNNRLVIQAIRNNQIVWCYSVGIYKIQIGMAHACKALNFRQKILEKKIEKNK